ncbi:MAG TPA: SDR family oxidoreductase, partial [Bryobacteraceae bacterium]
TGLSGMLGSNLARHCAAAGLSVSGISHRRRLNWPGVRQATADIAEPNYTAGLEPFASGLAIHCAAATDVDWCEKNEAETFRLNVEATGRLAAEAAQAGWRFVYISTDSVFDGSRGNYSERDTPRPVNVYARSKLAGEQAALAAGPDALIVRTNFYGLGGWNRGLAEWLLQQLSASARINGFDDVVFSPLFVGDLCPLILELARAGVRGVVHVGSADSCSKYEFAIRMGRAFGLDTSVVTRSALGAWPRVAQRPLNTSLNVSKARGMLGRDLPSIEQGIQKFREIAAEYPTPVLMA